MIKLEIQNMLSLHDFNIKDIEKDEEIVQVIEFLYQHIDTLQKKDLTFEIDITHIGSIFMKDYDSEITFEVKNKKEKYSIELFGFMFQKNRLYPLHIVCGDYEQKCSNFSELKRKLNKLYETELSDWKKIKK